MKSSDSILCAKQTNYMPQIPDIAKCPEQLLPLKEWEDAFLADFSDLRTALSRCKEGLSKLVQTILDNSGVHDSSASEREFEGCPTLSEVMRMDSVARVSALKKRVIMAESASNLSKSNYLWLFFLSAAVDSPLDADTRALFRALLRKCATLRAEKSVVDEQVAMFNILVIISGRYFGQAEEFESRKRRREDEMNGGAESTAQRQPKAPKLVEPSCKA